MTLQLTLFNIFLISIFDKCILRMKLDTNLCRLNFDIKLGLFYSVLPWYNNNVYEEYYNKSHRVIDILCPFLCDIRLFIQG